MGHAKRIGLIVVCVVSIGFIMATFYMEFDYMLRNYTLDDRVEAYENLRKGIVEGERFLQMGGKVDLTDKEMEVNDLLMVQKFKEVEEGPLNLTHFKPTQDICEVVENIRETPVFKLLRTMPKGGVLHTRDMALCSTDFLVKLTYHDNLWVCVSRNKDLYEKLRFAREQPEPVTNCDWMSLKQLRDLKGALLVDRSLREQFTLNQRYRFLATNETWTGLRRIFGLVEGLLTYEPIWTVYNYHALEEFHADGVQYLEIRSALPLLYNLDGGNYTIMDTVRAMRDVSIRFQMQHWDFIGAKLIYAPPRNVSDIKFEEYLDDAIELQYNFPDYFVGFDLTSEEDLGRPIRDFAFKLFSVQNKLNFYFHAGETNWYGTTIDENLIDAVLLGTKRIGHGYALCKHPKVLHRIKAENIAIEVCPISNQVLQHLNDFRNHPASLLFANNFPVVIASDSPSFWRVAPITHDFYVAFVGITSKFSGLGTLKQLAWNSLQYSGLVSPLKEQALQVWERKWNNWVDKVSKHEVVE